MRAIIVFLLLLLSAPHSLAGQSNQDNDEESGLPHLAHLGANVMMLMDAMKNNKNIIDNRNPNYKRKDK